MLCSCLICVLRILVHATEANLQSNGSVVKAQLDTYGLHRQTFHCREEGEEKGEKPVDNESIGAKEQR